MDKFLDPRAHLQSGFAAAERGDWARAIAHLRVAVAAAPQLAEGWMHFGSALQHVGRLDDAERVARQALVLSPGLVGAHNVLALIDIDRRRFDQAIGHARRAIELDPRYSGSWVNLGVAQSGVRDDEAAASLARALELDPASAIAHYNLGALRHAQGRHEEAMHHYREAIRLDPRHGHAHGNLALALFSTGAFEEAWSEYRWRPERLQYEKLLRREGRERVAVHGEQGLGDLLFFLRFAGALRESGATLDFVGDERLHGMLARTGLFAALAPRLADLPETDRDIVLASDLPLEVPGLAAATPPPLALHPEAHRAAAVRSRLEALGPPPYIALAWRAGEPRAGRVVNLFKQVPPEALGEALRGMKATWIAVQRDPSREEMERISKSLGAPVHDWSAINADLEEALAVMAAIDDYAGVSSTLVHLRAGAGGRARILVPFPPEWRWMESGDKSPWFPRATVYRQSADGDWGAALARLAADQRDQGGAVPGSTP